MLLLKGIKIRYLRWLLSHRLVEILRILLLRINDSRLWINDSSLRYLRWWQYLLIFSLNSFNLLWKICRQLPLFRASFHEIRNLKNLVLALLHLFLILFILQPRWWHKLMGIVVFKHFLERFIIIIIILLLLDYI